MTCHGGLLPQNGLHDHRPKVTVTAPANGPSEFEWRGGAETGVSAPPTRSTVLDGAAIGAARGHRDGLACLQLAQGGKHVVAGAFDVRLVGCRLVVDAAIVNQGPARID